MLPTSPKHVKTFEKNAIWRTLGKALGKAVRRRATKKFPGLSKDFGKKGPLGNRKYTQFGKETGGSRSPPKRSAGPTGSGAGAWPYRGPAMKGYSASRGLPALPASKVPPNLASLKKMDPATLERFKKGMRRTKGRPKNPWIAPWPTKLNPKKPFKNPLLTIAPPLGSSDKFKNLWKPKK